MEKSMPGPASSSTSKEFYCSCCDLDLKFKRMYDEHVQGKKHKKNEKIVQDKINAECSIFVSNLRGINDPQALLKSYFGTFGSVVKVTNKGPGAAAVRFTSPESVKQAVQSSPHNIRGCRIFAREMMYRPRDKRGEEEKKRAEAEVGNRDVKELLCQEKDMSHQFQFLTSHLLLSQKDLDIRSDICGQLSRIFYPYFETTSVHQFGSSINGYGMTGCDLDLFLDFNIHPGVVPQEHKAGKTLYPLPFKPRGIKTLPGQEIPFSQGQIVAMDDLDKVKLVCQILFHENRRLFRELFVVPAKRCPIVQFVHAPSGLKCDLSLNNRKALYNSRLLRLYGQDKRVQQLVLAVRFWARVQNLNSHGGTTCFMTSYASTWLVLYYLMNTTPRVIPPVIELTDLLKEQGVQEEMIDCHRCLHIPLSATLPPSDNTESTASLLRGFFRFYASTIDWENQALSTWDSFLLPKHSMKGDATYADCKIGAMTMLDPFVLCHNILGNVTERVHVRFESVMKKAFGIAQKWTDEDEISRPDGDEGNKPWGLAEIFIPCPVDPDELKKKNKGVNRLSGEQRGGLFTICLHPPNQELASNMVVRGAQREGMTPNMFWCSLVHRMVLAVLKSVYMLEVNKMEGGVDFTVQGRGMDGQGGGISGHSGGMGGPSGGMGQQEGGMCGQGGNMCGPTGGMSEQGRKIEMCGGGGANKEDDEMWVDEGGSGGVMRLDSDDVMMEGQGQMVTGDSKKTTEVVIQHHHHHQQQHNDMSKRSVHNNGKKGSKKMKRDDEDRNDDECVSIIDDKKADGNSDNTSFVIESSAPKPSDVEISSKDSEGVSGSGRTNPDHSQTGQETTQVSQLPSKQLSPSNPSSHNKMKTKNKPQSPTTPPANSNSKLSRRQLKKLQKSQNENSFTKSPTSPDPNGNVKDRNLNTNNSAGQNSPKQNSSKIDRLKNDTPAVRLREVVSKMLGEHPSSTKIVSYSCISQHAMWLYRNQIRSSMMAASGRNKTLSLKGLALENEISRRVLEKLDLQQKSEKSPEQTVSQLPSASSSSSSLTSPSSSSSSSSSAIAGGSRGVGSGEGSSEENNVEAAKREDLGTGGQSYNIKDDGDEVKDTDAVRIDTQSDRRTPHTQSLKMETNKEDSESEGRIADGKDVTTKTTQSPNSNKQQSSSSNTKVKVRARSSPSSSGGNNKATTPKSPAGSGSNPSNQIMNQNNAFSCHLVEVHGDETDAQVLPRVSLVMHTDQPSRFRNIYSSMSNVIVQLVGCHLLDAEQTLSLSP